MTKPPRRSNADDWSRKLTTSGAPPLTKTEGRNYRAPVPPMNSLDMISAIVMLATSSARINQSMCFCALCAFIASLQIFGLGRAYGSNINPR
jgi:hypothetical protein